jgi:hypothetical protein
MGSISDTGTVASGVNFRNLVINGDMSIAQRGTSESSVTTGGYKTIDRWQNVGIFGTWTISQSTDVPSGQGFSSSFKMDCTTANASPSAGNQLHISQRIEGQNVQYLKKGTSSAESLTLSFWVKTNKTGTYQVNLRDKDNTRIIGQTYTVSSADTWEKKTITFAGDTTGTFGNDDGNSLECEWFLGAGSTYTGGAVPTSWEAESAGDRAAGLTVNLADNTANEWFITGVQLEVGSSATDFEFLPYDVNLQRCQRYYFDTASVVNGEAGSGLGGIFTFKAFNSNEAAGYNAFPVTMRTNPTITVTDNGGVDGKIHRFASGDVGSSVTFGNVSNSAVIACNETSTFTTGEPNIYGGRIRANAEL